MQFIFLKKIQLRSPSQLDWKICLLLAPLLDVWMLLISTTIPKLHSWLL
jgi:hypothetical protein